jgi:hypothetical protein
MRVVDGAAVRFGTDTDTGTAIDLADRGTGAETETEAFGAAMRSTPARRSD